MKTLHLIRHAKSSWQDPELADINRPLNQRGLDSCRVIATQMLNAGWNAQHIFASPATRVQQTLENLRLALEPLSLEWTTDDSLYTFNWQVLFSWCQQQANELDALTIVGHNPALTELHNCISHEPLVNIPTCAYVKVVLDIQAWTQLQPNCGQTQVILKPKTFLPGNRPGKNV